MNELLTEEKEYCDRGNYAHMSQILTSIALYETLQKHGYSETEANWQLVRDDMILDNQYLTEILTEGNYPDRIPLEKLLADMEA